MNSALETVQRQLDRADRTYQLVLEDLKRPLKRPGTVMRRATHWAYVNRWRLVAASHEKVVNEASSE